MQILSVNVHPIVGQALSTRGLVFLVGKVCLVAAVFLALEMGDNLRLAGRVAVPSVDLNVAEDPMESSAKKNFQAYSIINARNVFGAKETKGEETKGTQPVTNLKLRLVGTNVSRGGSSFAIIENTANKEQDVFDLNGTVFEQAKLVEILPERVKLDRGGNIEVLLLEESADQGGASGTTEDSGRTEFTVAEDELNNELANLPRLLSQARAVPYFRNGKSVGMRLFAIRAQSLYEKLGMKNGDIVKSVNNNSLADPTQALKLFEQLKSERSISVKLEREGQDIDLNYTIR